jgi:hypothetical protein
MFFCSANALYLSGQTTIWGADAPSESIRELKLTFYLCVFFSPRLCVSAAIIEAFVDPNTVVYP